MLSLLLEAGAGAAKARARRLTRRGRVMRCMLMLMLSGLFVGWLVGFEVCEVRGIGMRVSKSVRWCLIGFWVLGCRNGFLYR
jgi:hypothetical protein